MAGCVNLGGATFLVLVIASVFFLIGFSTTSWYYGSLVFNIGNRAWPGELNFNAGLWAACVSQHCAAYSSTPGWLKATQGLETIGLILLIVSAILMALYLFSESSRTPRFALNVIIWAFIAGGFIVIGVIILGQNVSEIGWSLALAAVGGALSLVGGVLATINYKRSATSG